MSLEAPFDLYINDLLREAGIRADYQSSNINEIREALLSASKSQTGNTGYLDFTALIGDYVIVIEDKAGRDKLFLRDDNGTISQTPKATIDYALNGALFYARKIIEGSSFRKIFAFGCAGDSKHHTLKPIFVGPDIVLELKECDTFNNFSPQNIEAYYKRAVLGEEPLEEIELRSIEKIAADFHNYLRNYGDLGTQENPLVVAAILLALQEQKYGFNLSQLTGDTEGKTDGQKLYDALEASLNHAHVAPQVKKEQVLNQFTLIKDRPKLNAVNENLGKTPLKFFAEFINKRRNTPSFSYGDIRHSIV